MQSVNPPFGSSPLPTDTAQILQRIEQHTNELVRWMKYLVGAVVVLIVVTALVIV